MQKRITRFRDLSTLNSYLFYTVRDEHHRQASADGVVGGREEDEAVVSGYVWLGRGVVL